MTKSGKMVTAGDRPERGEKIERSKIPYALPADAQLLAYWHYQNKVNPTPDLRNIPHTWSEDKSKDEKSEAARKHDATTSLLDELKNAQIRYPFSRSRYVQDMRQLSIWRLLTGRKRDGCIQLDQQLDIEHRKYLEIKRQYKECANALEQFLAQDHESSMRILHEADTELARTAELSERRDELSRRYGQTRLEVYHCEEAWRTVKACHKFLHKVSPLGIDIDDDHDNYGADDDAIDEMLAKEKMRMEKTVGSEIATATSLESLIEAFEKEAMVLSKSGLSSKEPSSLGLVEAGDLLRLFRDIELQNLNALIHLESLGGPMADMIARIDVAEVRVRREIEDVLEGIKQLEEDIDRENQRALRLEQQATELVQKNFRALICSEQALQARVLVEDAYESCVAKNETGLEPLAMARSLEAAYERLSAELDGLPRHLVVACEREGFKRELKETREVEDAARKFELMHRLLDALRRIMEPNEPKRRMLMRRSVPKIRTKATKVKKRQNADSSKEKDDLHMTFFSERCKHEKKIDEKRVEE